MNRFDLHSGERQVGTVEQIREDHVTGADMTAEDRKKLIEVLKQLTGMKKLLEEILNKKTV